MTSTSNRIPGLARGRSRWPLVLACGAFVAAGACGGGSAGPPGAAGPGPGGAAMAMPVGIREIQPQPVEDVSEFVAVLKSRRSSAIQPQAEGFITHIHVKSGDRVAVGAPLFAIDSSPQLAVVASLESTRAAREADAAFARQQLERARKLLDVGASSLQEFEQATNAARSAEAQLKAVDEQIRQQRAELAYYQVVAPTSGIIGDVPVRVGDRVTKTSVLTTIDDNSGLEVYINVPVQQASRLRTGLAVRLMDDAGATILTERLNFVSASVDEGTQTVLAKAPLAERQGQFRSEQFVRTRIVWSSDPALVVPTVAVVRVSGQQFVYVAEPADGGGLVARLRAVTLGALVGQDYVLQSGLKPGERIVVSGIQTIGDGMPVQALPPAAAAPGAGGGR